MHADNLMKYYIETKVAGCKYWLSKDYFRLVGIRENAAQFDTYEAAEWVLDSRTNRSHFKIVQYG